MKKLMLMLMVVLLVGSVSAVEWNDKLSYSNNDLKVSWDNWWGLGQTIGTAELKSHKSVNEVKQVSIGSQVVMWYDFNFTNLYINGFGEITFKNMKTGEYFDREYELVYWGEKEINVYGQGNCQTILGNGTGINCEEIVIAKTKVYDWLSYNSTDIPKGNVRIGVMVDVKSREKTDVIWAIVGKKVLKHAEFTGNGEFSPDIALADVGGVTTNTVELKALTTGIITMTRLGSASAPLMNSTTYIIQDNIILAQKDFLNWRDFTQPNITFAIVDYLNVISNVTAGGVFFIQSNVTAGSGSMASNGTYPAFSGTLFNYSAQTMQAHCGACGEFPLHTFNETTEPVVAPIVTLNSPIDTFNSTSQIIVFNGTASDNVNLINVSLFIDGILNETNSSGINNTNYIFTKTLSEGSHNWTYSASDNESQTTTATVRNFTVDTKPIINVVSPTNNSNFTISTIFFNATSSLAVDTWIVNYNGTNTTLSDINTSLEVEDGFHHLLLYANNSVSGIFGLNDTIFFSVDATEPSLNVTAPTGLINFGVLFINETLNWNVTDTNIDSCFYDYNFTNRTVACADNTTTFELSSQRNLTFYANDTFGNLVSNFTNWSYLIFGNSRTFNASSFETEAESFSINITTNGTAPTNANLVYNGTTFNSVTITNTAGNDYNLTKAIDIPLISGNKTWFFNFTIEDIIINSTTQTQLINVTNFTFCESGFTPVYINFTFKNETVAEETVSAEIDVDWNFWLGGGSIFKTLSFTNTTENFDYGFCLIDTGDRILNTNVSLNYDNSISQQRSFSRSFTLTNTTTNQTLFLLPTTDGLFVTFQTVTVAEQVISGVDVNVTKLTDLISTGITDDAGLVQFFLDPDTTYTFTFFKEGFDLVTTSLKPTQSSFTITMGSQVIQEENDTTKGITYTINPISNVLANDTEIEFNLSFSSSFWILDVFGFALKNSTGTIFNITSSTTDTGGFLSRQLNTGDNENIIMEIFWTIGGNQTNVTRTWLVFDTSDEGFSIKTFFDDLSTFLTSGMFGLTNFGLGIIIFSIILIVTGVLSVKFGITNPPGIAIIIFSLVLFFDVGLGIMPNPVGAVNNFPTIFVGLIFLGTLLREGIK